MRFKGREGEGKIELDIVKGKESCVNYNKLEFATKLQNHKILQSFLFSFVLRGVTCYLDILFLLFTEYADHIFQVISNFHIQRSKVGRKSDKFAINYRGL